MDYQAFYADVANWIMTVNQQAATLGMQSEAFWAWVTESAGQIGNKYGNTDLVVKQLLMLIDWLEEVYKNMQ
ncbi:MAG TPA: hypothetical protein H9948_11065 [Candidatus Jeotgalibaca merdavium]|uniref:Uncharacterized protein n=1 Tax=Candidatus Jeotgalibaca merdavium TaxID=2838627 RepID=A0A9D2I226_9LACT|nr:hypothetical protein [Candidatus Jeotgalibaca merdavium]